MTDNDKIYYPEVIDSYVLPETVAPTDNASGGTSTSKDSSLPSELRTESYPTRVIARETIAESLNTKTKKILGNFTFGQVGAIAIGVYENGVSGDVRITPDGIVARNISGVTTFSLDGTNGSAVFLGTVTAGSLISGNIVVGGADNVSGEISVLDTGGVERVLLDKDGIVVNNGRIVVKNNSDVSMLDAYGLVSSVNFPFAIVTSADTSDTTTSTTYQDVTGMSVDITVSRSQQVFFICKVSGGQNNGDLESTSPNNCQFILNVAGSQVGSVVSCYSVIYQDPISSPSTVTYVATDTYISTIATLAAGTSTVKIQFRSSSSGKSVRCVPSLCNITYFKLGS